MSKAFETEMQRLSQGGAQFGNGEEEPPARRLKRPDTSQSSGKFHKHI